MTDNKQATKVVVPNNGKLWTVVRDDLAEQMQSLLFIREDFARYEAEMNGRPAIGTPCRVVELHVQTAEARAEQMRRLAKVIENAHFYSGYEKAYAAGEIAEILGLDERWYYTACGMDPDEAMAEGDGKVTLGDVSDE